MNIKKRYTGHVCRKSREKPKKHIKQ